QSASPADSAASASTPAQQTSVSPPGMNNRPLLPGQTDTARTPDGMPALQPARGVNLENVFAENIKDPVDRVKRVENAVIELRRDFDSVLPAIVRLSAVEADMQELLGQLESLLRNEPPTASTINYVPEAAPQPLSTSPAPTPSPTPAPVPAPQPQAAAPPPAATPAPVASTPPPAASAPIPGAVSVTGLRLGEHKDKTRLVMDMTGASSYRYDLDNAENLLVIELAGAGWTAAQSQTMAKSPLVQSYSVQAMDGGGTRVIIQLKRAVNVIYEAALKPEGGNSSHRIVLDLKGQ
ncbi:MAG: AMIN domain-containing protein, partial [Alphaproteobacteria bacterium]|nr:AMIN domain-containing protein [Alphaproteobacteria bacterium]